VSSLFVAFSEDLAAALSEELKCTYVWMEGWNWCLRRDERGLVT